MDEIAYWHPVQDNMGSLQHILKRMSDILLSATALVILSPVLLVLYIVLRVTAGRHVIFKQERIGRYGKPFTLYKFRTLKEGTEDEEPLLNPDPDPALSTPLQLWLRKRHLDELPQLWNVLTGDMSIVGPRPERQFFIDKIMEVDHGYEYIFEMRPGLTSEATLYNGYTDTMEKMIKRLHIDIMYLQNRTLALDARIMWDTLVSIVAGKKI